jgi:UDPglucose 6-dehydrogenase
MAAITRRGLAKRSHIGIMGYGMVGGAVGAWFTGAAKYSPHRFADGLDEVNRTKIVFVCAPSPYSSKAGYDMSAILASAKKLAGRKIVVLKSTVLPGTTARLQRRFPQHTWLFNPEFLRDKSAVEDFRRPDRQIIGLAAPTRKHRLAARRVMRLLPTAPYTAVVTSTEAELIKVFANAYLATKVVFANMIYDVASRLGADYEVVKRGVSQDARITASMMNVWQDGFRGYSGKCFPKDMGAIIWWGRHHGPRLPLLETADRLNLRLLPKDKRRRS